MLRKTFRLRLAREEDLVVYDRKPGSDDEVKAFVQEQLAADPNAKRTRLLAEWRKSGRACEQSRFKAIYLEMKGESDGQPQ